MKFLKYLLFLLLIAIIGVAIYIAVQPNEYSVTRSRSIQAPASVIYENVIDFKKWEAWSPWIEKNPDTRINYPEQTKDVGGSYSWEDEDGIGTMTTIDAVENQSILQHMQFEDFPPSEVSWNFDSSENGLTKVTWNISGKDLPFMFKMYSTFTGGMEKNIGPDFERGLEKLDSIAIESMKIYSIVINGETTHSGGFYLYNTTSSKISEFESKMKETLPKVSQYAITNNIPMAGAPFIYYHKWDEANDAVIFSSCIPTSDQVITTSDSDILTGQLQPFKAINTTLKGDYINLKEAWEKTMKFITESHYEFTASGPMIEIYQTDPMSAPNPADWITQIYIAVK
ncbi:SRPBCC family protein [Yeosuana sp. MJ-SS3]|uniref:SRPBCC family protein n=1 Tax=Gilvirhabdus luticola TaxID=3079858 RepID=A0ABU3U6P4_9FLAO|nr:GyrI-like domain-containing protein [Yeosuana sp. MJ-SS3]MDU8886068.1 SRPBCC family protein [Yeosuana sp. MJ-SS3]